MPRTILALLLLGELVYTLVRYHGLKGVPLSDLPLYTLNKWVAWAALTLVALAITLGPWRRWRARGSGGAATPAPPFPRTLGRAGAALVGLHVLISLLITVPGYFPDWFAEGRLLTAPAVGMLAGVAATWLLSASWRGGSAEPEADALRRDRTLVVALAALHALAIGWESWLDPSAWPGHLPPITLLSFVFAGLAVSARFLAPGANP